MHMELDRSAADCTVGPRLQWMHQTLLLCAGNGLSTQVPYDVPSRNTNFASRRFVCYGTFCTTQVP